MPGYSGSLELDDNAVASSLLWFCDDPVHRTHFFSFSVAVRVLFQFQSR